MNRRKAPAWLLLALLVPAAALAGGPDEAPGRPACSASTHGLRWPQGPMTTEHSRQCEEVALCVRSTFGHRWQTVRVPYWKYSRLPAPAACSLPSSNTASDRGDFNHTASSVSEDSSPR